MPHRGSFVKSFPPAVDQPIEIERDMKRLYASSSSSTVSAVIQE